MEKKNNSGMLGGLLLGLVIAAIVVGGLYATGNINFKKTTTNNEQTSENNKSIKIDESKEYVYDADYKYDNKYTKYSDDYNEPGDTIDYFGINIPRGKNDITTLKVPYLNINSNEAKIVNEELEKIYLKYAEEFDKYAADAEKNSNNPICHQILNYKKYQYNNILSIIVFYDTQCTSPFVFNYLTYNFDLTTGNKISFEEMVSILGYNKDTIVENMKALTKTGMDKYFKSVDLSVACKGAGKGSEIESFGTDSCYEITNKLLQRTIDDDSILFFTDNDGNLNVLPLLYIANVQNGDRNHYLIKVTK